MVYVSFWGGYATLPQNSTTTKTQLTKALKFIMDKVVTQIFIGCVMAIFLGVALYYAKIFDYYSEENTYRGHYVSGFESNEFLPCGTGDVWWVENEAESKLYSEYTKIAKTEYQPIYVEVIGSLSEDGPYGHMGIGSKELKVLEVLSIGGSNVQCELKGHWSGKF